MNSNLISKVYFPRLVVVVSSVITSFVDFFISAIFLVALMPGTTDAAHRYMLPAVPCVACLWRLAGDRLMACRAYGGVSRLPLIVPFMVQFGLYVSPVGFQSSVVPARFRRFTR